MSNDIAECGCEGHAENLEACDYPEMKAQRDELFFALYEALQRFDTDGEDAEGPVVVLALAALGRARRPR